MRVNYGPNTIAISDKVIKTYRTKEKFVAKMKKLHGERVPESVFEIMYSTVNKPEKPVKEARRQEK